MKTTHFCILWDIFHNLAVFLQQSIKSWKNEDNWIESWRCQLFFSHFTANHLLQLIVAYCCSKVVSSCKCIKDYRAMTWQYREGFQDIYITLKQQTLKYVHMGWTTFYQTSDKIKHINSDINIECVH